MSEGLWIIVVGIGVLAVAVLGFKHPELFLHGRRSGFWAETIGEEKTKKLIRYFSVPLTVIIGVFVILVGVSKLGQ